MSFSLNVYSITYTVEGVKHSICLTEETNEAGCYRIKPANLNEEDKNQLWVFYPDNGQFHNLKHPNIMLADEEPESNENELFADSNAGNENNSFDVTTSHIATQNNKKIVFDQTKNIFRFSSEEIPSQTFSMTPVDVSYLSLHVPPPAVPFAIVYSVAAQEFAVTLQMNDHLNGEGRRIMVKPFEPGKDAAQYWYYLPDNDLAIMSCADANEALDCMMNSREGYDVIYTHRHHGRDNQQWRFEHRYIVNVRFDKVLTYVENDPNFFRSMDKGIETNPQRFCCVPYFGKIDGLLKVEDVLPTHNEDYSSVSDHSSMGSDNDSERISSCDDSSGGDYDSDSEVW